MLVLKQILLVGAGGMIGSIGRHLIFVAAGAQNFPYSTLAINVTGSFLIGLLAGLFLDQLISNEWLLFLATGVCGGFTTFSSFSMECVTMLQQQKYLAAATYIALSIVLGIAAGFAGFSISK